MPKIADLASRIIDLVADELEIPRELILSKSRKAEVVDARHTVAKLLHLNHVYPSRIAGIFGVSARNVQYVITTFDARIQTNRALRNTYERLAKELRNNYETTT